MTEVQPQVKERRNNMVKTVTQLVAERQQVMVVYCKLAENDTFDKVDIVKPDLRELCQLMVDYTALGHFEIYQRIIEGKERRQPVRDVAGKVYPALAETTDILVDFNDKYETVDDIEDINNLSNDLSKLGETFAVRIELEDQILETLAGQPI